MRIEPWICPACQVEEDTTFGRNLHIEDHLPPWYDPDDDTDPED